MIGLFDDPILLTNAKVSLRPLSLDHIDRIADFALDEDLWTFAQRPIKRWSKEGVEHFVRNQLQDRTIRHGYPFTIVDMETKAVAGLVRFENISPRHQRLEIGGTVMGKEYQRKGLMKAAAFLLLEYAFTELDAVRVASMADLRNEPAQLFLTSIGATTEGTLRHYLIDMEAKPCDMRVYSIISSEWENIKQQHFSEYL